MEIIRKKANRHGALSNHAVSTTRFEIVGKAHGFTRQSRYLRMLSLFVVNADGSNPTALF